MELAEFERRKDEKVNGVVYNMSPAPGYQHGIVNNNINTIIKHAKMTLADIFEGAFD